jgi:hypothetical protein
MFIDTLGNETKAPTLKHPKVTKNTKVPTIKAIKGTKFPTTKKGKKQTGKFSHISLIS